MVIVIGDRFSGLNGASSLLMEYEENQDKCTIYVAWWVIAAKVWTGGAKECPEKSDSS